MKEARDSSADGNRTVRPVILSASRATDIPAFYADWFMNRLRAGYFPWVNPFRPSQVWTVSTEKVRAIVFWSKHPAGLPAHLEELDRRGLQYVIHYTLNDYEAEGLEPRLPPLAERVKLFRRLAKRLGPDRVIWRLDPLVWTDRCGVPDLLAKAQRVAEQLDGCTRKLVFSFVDIEGYSSVKRRLARAGIAAREPSSREMAEVAEGLGKLGRAHGLEVATCAEEIDLSAHGIAHNRCVDGEGLTRLWPEDSDLAAFVCSPEGRRDKGQRKACGCTVSKDIGRYRTCPHRCVYCYANHSEGAAERAYREHDPDRNSL
jgi:hypothetical protein